MPSRPPFDAPVVALDIDGTLGDYHGHFLTFAQQYLGKPMPDPKESTEGEPLYQLMHVSKATYRQVKLAYRQGGLKRSMPCYPGAAQISRIIRESGYRVWICTTRPYLRLDNIDPDTRHWLRRNSIQYDGVLFGDHKYRDLERAVNGNVLMVVDDLPPMLKQAMDLGMSAVLRDQPYNRKWVRPVDVPAVRSMEELLEAFFSAEYRYTKEKERSNGREGSARD